MKEARLNIAFNTLNLRKFKKGFFSFLIISFCALLAIFLYNYSGKSFFVLKQVKPLFLLLAVIASVLDMLLGGWRNHFLLKYFYVTISPWICFKANLVNVFMSAVTPSQSGGGPGFYYFLYKHGVKLADAVVVSVINWISTIVFFLISASISFYFLNDHIPNGFLVVMMRYSFVIFSGILVAISVIMIRPGIVEKVISKLFSLGVYVFWKNMKSIEPWKSRVLNLMKEYRIGLINVMKTNPGPVSYTHLTLPTKRIV